MIKLKPQNFFQVKNFGSRKSKDFLGNKKAEGGEGEKYLSAWNYFIWAIVGLGVVVSIIIFYSAQVDVRIDEADILATRILDCLVDEGYLRADYESFDVFGDCAINQKIIEDKNEFYFNISIYKEDGTVKEIKKGYGDLEMQCKLKTKEEHFADCKEKSVYALSRNKEQKFLIKVLAASNQQGRKLR